MKTKMMSNYLDADMSLLTKILTSLILILDGWLASFILMCEEM